MQNLWDASIEVLRATEARGFMNEVVRGFAVVVSASRNGRVDPPAFRQRTGMPGEADTGVVYVFMDACLDVRERDVLRVLAGPEAGRTLRVLGRAKPGGNHWELVTVPFEGPLRTLEVQT